MLTTFLLALVGSPPVTSPVDPIRYRIEVRTEVQVDLSMFGQPDQIQTSAFAWYVTMSYRDSAGGRVMHAVVDSAQADVSMLALTQATYDSARGTVFHGWLNPGGRLESLTVEPRSTLMTQLEAVLRGFHPRIRQGAAVGDRWSDTTEVDARTDEGGQSSVTVTAFTMGGPETRDGEAVRRLDAEFSTTLTGQVNTQAGPADMTGTAAGTTVYYVTPQGQYVGGMTSAKGDMSVRVAMAPAPIPVRNTSTTTVTVLR